MSGKNRIVVDYGDLEALVMLGSIEINSGYLYGPNESAAILNWEHLTTEVMPYKSINEVLASDHRSNAEGFVIRAGNKLVKYKYPDYIELHRLISNLSEKSVWSGLAGGKTVEQLIEGLPDEFHGFVRETSGKLIESFVGRKTTIERKFAYLELRADIGPDRKRFAMAVKDDPDKKYMFALLDNKPIDQIIWGELKPQGGLDDTRALLKDRHAV